jgi:hypothetical protein
MAIFQTKRSLLQILPYHIYNDPMVGIVFYGGRHDLMHETKFYKICRPFTASTHMCTQMPKRPHAHFPIYVYQRWAKRDLGQFNSVELITEKWAVSVTQVIKALWNNSPFSKDDVKSTGSQLKRVVMVPLACEWRHDTIPVNES